MGAGYCTLGAFAINLSSAILFNSWSTLTLLSMPLIKMYNIQHIFMVHAEKCSVVYELCQSWFHFCSF